MNILAVDCCLKLTGAALMVDGRVIASEQADLGRRQSQELPLMAERVMQGLSWDALDYVAITNGRTSGADLYRLDDAGSLGLEEYAGDEGCVLFVEWPERWRNPPVDEVLAVKIEAVSETERRVIISAQGASAEGVVMKL